MQRLQKALHSLWISTIRSMRYAYPQKNSDLIIILIRFPSMQYTASTNDRNHPRIREWFTPFNCTKTLFSNTTPKKPTLTFAFLRRFSGQMD